MYSYTHLPIHLRSKLIRTHTITGYRFEILKNGQHYATVEDKDIADEIVDGLNAGCQKTIWGGLAPEITSEDKDIADEIVDELIDVSSYAGCQKTIGAGLF